MTNIYSNRQRVGLGLQQPTGAWTNGFAYDSARRLSNVISPAGSFAYEYLTGVGGSSGFASKLVRRLLLPNSAAITNDYDVVARVVATHLRTSSGALTNSHEYLYNLAGQRAGETRIDASTVAYAYDSIGQLKVADSSVSGEDRGYMYDAAWNLHYRTNDGVLASFTVDGLNQLTNFLVSPSAERLIRNHDANGNVISSTDDAYELVEYTYDDENRLIRWYRCDLDSGEPVAETEFTYDGLGRLRVVIRYGDLEGEEWTSSDAWTYVYDGMREVQQRLNGAPRISYTRGNDLSGSKEGAGGIGGLLALSAGNGWTSHYYYHADGNGNITFILSSGQSLAARYRYDPFGNTISSTGSLAGGNVYRFSSKPIDPASGMYYYGYRFYDPSVQRWINRDPIEELGGFNLYTFVLNRPTSGIDAFGLSLIGTIPILNLVNCFYPEDGESMGDYASIRLPGCKECEDDPDAAEQRCKDAVDAKALTYVLSALGTVGVDLVQDWMIVMGGKAYPPIYLLIIPNGIATACEIKAVANIGKASDNYKSRYCKCPQGKKNSPGRAMK